MVPVRLQRFWINFQHKEYVQTERAYPSLFCALNQHKYLIQGHSSIGRVAVSKTAGCGFEPCCPCRLRSASDAFAVVIVNLIATYFDDMEKLTLYLRESYDELMNNVSWPTYNQLVESTVVVLVTAAILALIIFLMDGISSMVFKTVYGIF